MHFWFFLVQEIKKNLKKQLFLPENKQKKTLRVHYHQGITDAQNKKKVILVPGW